MTVSRSEQSGKAKKEKATKTVSIVSSQNIWCYMCQINVIDLTNIPSDTFGYLLQVILTCNSVFPENSSFWPHFFPTWLSSRTWVASGYNSFVFFSFFKVQIVFCKLWNLPEKICDSSLLTPTLLHFKINWWRFAIYLFHFVLISFPTVQRWHRHQPKGLLCQSVTTSGESQHGQLLMTF